MYLNIFKNLGKAKQIFCAVVGSSASENHRDNTWFKEAENALKTMATNEPSNLKAKLLEELKPDLDKIREAIKDAAGNIQKIIDYVYAKHPPISKKDGAVRPKPSVVELGEAKAVRKVILHYHPDRIDSSDMKYKLLCEEITKIFTERAG